MPGLHVLDMFLPGTKARAHPETSMTAEIASVQGLACLAAACMQSVVNSENRARGDFVNRSVFQGFTGCLAYRFTTCSSLS